MTDAGTDERSDGRLIIMRQPDAPEKARISGALTGDGIRIVLDVLGDSGPLLPLRQKS